LTSQSYPKNIFILFRSVIVVSIMPATLSLSQTRIVVILLSVFITLLLLRNNLTSFHQSSNFILFLSNHLESKILLFSMTTCLFCTIASASATNILSVYSVVSSEISSLVILNNSNCSDNVFILFP